MNSRVWHEEGYEIRENEVVYWVCVMGCHPWTVLGADLETFYIINERYAADKNHIYAANDLIVIDPNGCFYRKDGRWFMNDEDCEKMYVEPSASVISREREKIIEEEYRKLRETQNLKKKELSEQ
ncbi:MAG: DKNYY domain-containing protein [Candidatus Gracilibacteria bacterium]|nr:DKNYY domain-containing protein [Candidatus Gracilibacteria bacterium]